MRKVLLAIDESEHSVRAFEYYNSDLRRDGDEVILVHCPEVSFHTINSSITSTFAPTDAVQSDVVGQVFSKAQLAAQGVQSKFSKLLTERKVPFQVVTDFGKAGEVIVNTASDVGAKMIVIGTRGLGKVRRTLLGSVSNYVVNHAGCAVVVVREF